MSDVRLHVGRRTFGGWKDLRVTRSMENLAGSFMLTVSDRWAGQAVAWPIAEEDRCQVKIDGETVIDGYVDRRDLSLEGTSRRLSFAGRDRAGALADCSARPPKWQFRNVNVLDFVKTIAISYGVVATAPGLTLPKLAKLTISIGDTAYTAIARAAAAAGVLVVSDGAGGVVLTRVGATRASALVEGDNILRASVSYDGSDRYYRYILASQAPGTDNSSGDATRVLAEAIDENVRRTDRTLYIRPKTGMTKESAKVRADWEARLRAAKSEPVTITVRGWRQANGDLWAVNTLSVVRAPGIGVNGEMLISQVDYSLGEGGELTTLRLLRPDAFTPEPTGRVKSAGRGSGWKELAGGAR